MSEEAKLLLQSCTKRREYEFKCIQILYDLTKTAKKKGENISTFRARYKNIEKIRQNFIDSNDAINKLNLEINPKFIIDNNVLLSFDDLYYACIEFADSLLEEKVGPQDQTSSKTSTTQVKLPKLQIPKFDGHIENWQTFKDSFLPLVHQNASLSDIEKFYYLLSCLSGSALSIAKGVPITAANYSVVYSALLDRFDNNRILATAYLDKILNLTPINKPTLTNLSELTNVLYESINALRALNIDNLGEFILFYISSRSLDADTRKRFEIQNNAEIPQFNDLINYLQNYIKILEVSQPTPATPSSSYSKPWRTSKNTQHSHTQNSLVSSAKSVYNSYVKNERTFCNCCNENHSIYRCSKLHAMNVNDRQNLVNELQLCVNCLRPGHTDTECKSKSSCFICKARHNTLLHVEPKSVETNCNTNTSLASTNVKMSAGCTKILGSAVVRVRHSDGSLQYARALIDSCSMDSFITSTCAQRLGLNKKKCNLSVTGLGESEVCSIKGYTFASILPRMSETPQFDLPLVVLPKITSMMPSASIPSIVKEKYKHLDLADREFYKPGTIDLLLGVECFDQIYTGSRFTAGPGLPCALSSVFGWVISGQFRHNVQTPNNTVTSLIASSNTLDALVQRFWEAEEPPKCNVTVPETEICEKKFKEGTYRNPDGRYVVPIMLKDDAPLLGNSTRIGLNRFLNLEKRLVSQPNLNAEYQKFMLEYESLGHMEPVESSLIKPFIIPHHCVVKPDSSTTRLRVVFDASCKTDNNYSLNDIVHVGPKLQIDIVDLITKFRLHRIVFTADICKMYRQILVRPEDRSYQHIFWRSRPHEALSEYELNTVTYGVSSSPFLAIRTLRQLAADHGNEYMSRAAQVLCEETFMDDIITGCSCLDEAKGLKEDLISLLSKGRFELRKWSTNAPDLLSEIPLDHCQTPKSFDETGQEFVKILGIQWDPKEDCFFYKFSDNFDVHFTKRSILSTVARIFDPVGWISPVIFNAKCLLQEMWRINLSWDESVPSQLAKQWHIIAANLCDLQTIKLPRLIVPPNPTEVHLVGFCDGSLKGFGCCVYLCVINENITTTNLLIGKSRVAPLKPNTVNRLELCAALLLAQVLSHEYNLLKQKININSIRAYSDSSTTLSWLNTPPHLLKMYVANRVVQTTELVGSEHWYHVSTYDNPADCCSRGVSCSELANHPLWWHGPSWLQSPPVQWPCKRNFLSNQDVPELKSPSQNLLINSFENILLTLTSSCSSYTKLLRVTAWCLRFISNIKSERTNRNFFSLSRDELDKANIVLVKFHQYYYMELLVNQVKNKERCIKSIQKLTPFLDNDGLLRVGGRINESNLPFSNLHPVLLPKMCHLSRLIVEHFHLKYLHCGPRTLQSLICRNFWILGVRLLIRTVLSKCVRCFKAKPTFSQPLMGKLPAVRVQPSKCFYTTGVDFGGPFIIKESRRRGAKTYKAYLCLFVCLSTKAVHLDVVTELSTEAFLAALDRFVSHRGLCNTIISDCGTNFIGANTYLKEIYEWFRKNFPDLSDRLSVRQIQWKFNPPGAPHFGGIFESGIKSTKFHLKRIVGNQILTLEELITVFSKIQAVLNSRPLCAASPDPQEIDVITPGHFLTGGPLVAIPERPLDDDSCPRQRWQMLRKITQCFWRIWQRDYLHTLQQKNKWINSVPNLNENDLVVVNDPHLPPLQWKLARIEQVHKGSDNIVRVVTLRTANGKIMRRPVVKVCRLPIN